ncbi:unnamed protein product [Ectocarpus fasciculatus]
MPMPSTSAEPVITPTPPRSTFTSGSVHAATATAIEASRPRSGESASSPPPQMWIGQPGLATGVPAGYAYPVEPVHGAWPDLEPQQQPHAPNALWRQEEPLVGGYAFVGPPASNQHYGEQDPRQQQEQQQQQEPAETENLITLSSSPPNN